MLNLSGYRTNTNALYRQMDRIYEKMMHWLEMILLLDMEEQDKSSYIEQQLPFDDCK